MPAGTITTSTTTVFSYFFQAGFSLAFGIAIVAIPSVKLARGEKLFNFRIGRRKY